MEVRLAQGEQIGCFIAQMSVATERNFDASQRGFKCLLIRVTVFQRKSSTELIAPERLAGKAPV
jgi:hypothetical protein